MENTKDSIFFMNHALDLARIASGLGEVPVGAVVVKDGVIVGEGYNRREIDKNPLAHAELIAIHQASQNLGGWRLWQCDIYVTLEPCPMCSGAIINSRIKHLIFGAWDHKSGCFGSLHDFNSMNFNHKPLVTSGVCHQESKQLLQDFFSNLRNNKKS